MGEHLNNLNRHRSMRPDQMHLSALIKLANAVAKSLLIILERLSQVGKVPEDWA